jgi:hypothetical protein
VLLQINLINYRKVAWAFEQSRTCPYTQDEVEFFSKDVVVSPDAKYTMNYLNLEASSVHVNNSNVTCNLFIRITP